MGSRKSELPPNYDRLPKDLQIVAMEEACRWALKVNHGHFLGEGLLKSEAKVKDLEE